MLSIGKRQKKWIVEAFNELGWNTDKNKIYYHVFDKHPRLCPSRMQILRVDKEWLLKT